MKSRVKNESNSVIIGPSPDSAPWITQVSSQFLLFTLTFKRWKVKHERRLQQKDSNDPSSSIMNLKASDKSPQTTG